MRTYCFVNAIFFEPTYVIFWEFAYSEAVMWFDGYKKTFCFPLIPLPSSDISFCFSDENSTFLLGFTVILNEE